MNHMPDIGIVYNHRVSSEAFDLFADEIRADGLSFILEKQEDVGGYACPEWFIWPVAAVFISKAYFDGFLKEAGKDHYHILKHALSKLTKNVMGNDDVEPVLIGSEGKLSSRNPFSLIFSIYAEAHDGNRFKLLIPKGSDRSYCEEAARRFLEFVEEFHTGKTFLDDIGFDESASVTSKHIFVHYNQDTNEIEWLDERQYR